MKTFGAKQYLIPSILIFSSLFFWLNKNPEVITRYSREFLCVFVFAPCILGMFIWKHNKWISGLLVWLGLTTTVNLFTGFITFHVASIEMLFFLSLALVFYLVHRLNTDLKLIVRTISYVVIFQAGLGVFQYFTGIYYPFENAVGKVMAVGLLDNPLNFAMFLAIGLPFVFYLHWLAGLFVLFAIILSGNLTAMIASVVGVCVLSRSKRALHRRVVIAGLVLLAVFFFFYKTQVLNLQGSSVIDRCRVWSESLKISNPFIGIGLGNYKVKMPGYMMEKNLRSEGILHMGNQLWNNPSNDYVRAVSEAGFPVLIFLFGFIYTTVKKYRSHKTYKTYIDLYFASFISILVLCVGYSLFLNPTNIIWAVIIIALLNSELNGREEKCCF